MYDSESGLPPIPGIETVPYLTNETLFERKRKMSRLVVIGGGPIGIEMAQAHQRLGSKVTVLEGEKILGKDDPELSAVVIENLKSEGIEMVEGAMVSAVELRGKQVCVFPMNAMVKPMMWQEPICWWQLADRQM